MNRLSGLGGAAARRAHERLLGRKTLEIEIREALAKSESKKPSLRLLSQPKDGSR
jgi:transposase